jgi:nucleoside 2-deoxyribosyltransferase
METTKVYLSGGFHSMWREKVKENLEGFTFFNPGDNQELNFSMDEIGVWNKHHLKKSDIVLAYFEKTNPVGLGLTAEMAYAYGLGKTVIFVMEANDTFKPRYLEFLENFATITVEDLDEAIELIRAHE